MEDTVEEGLAHAERKVRRSVSSIAGSLLGDGEPAAIGYRGPRDTDAAVRSGGPEDRDAVRRRQSA